MKALLFTLILSIFFAIGICKAQNKPAINSKEKKLISLCNLKDTIIHIAELNKLMAEGCDRIIYTDIEGNELKLTRYLFYYAPAKGEVSHFQQVEGDRINATIKNWLKNIKVGDKIFISQLKGRMDFSTEKPPMGHGDASKIYKIVE
jgi:hypothetical protein